MKQTSYVLAISAICGLFGCNQPTAAPGLGSYQGTLILGASKSLKKFAVSANLTQPSQNTIHIEMTGYPTISASLDLTMNSDGSVTLDAPGTELHELSLSADHGCYAANSPISVQLCSTPTSVVVSAQSSTESIYSLNLEYFGGVASDVQLEAPQGFTLDSAIAHTMTRNFNTQIEFQHMLQARLAAKNAYLELMPHLTGGSVLGITTGGPLSVIGILGMAGDLAPFLLPSRWLQAIEMGQLSDAESDSLAIMRGDAALNVEILAYTIDHDEQLLKFLQKDFDDLTTMRREVAQLENQNQIPAGTTAHLDSILAKLHDMMDDVSYPLEAVYSALSQAMGFVNPQAVSHVALPAITANGPMDPVDGQSELDLSDYQQLVLDRSIELRQFDHLIDAAKTAKTADYFSWLDPAAMINQSLGFGLGTTIEIDQDHVVALQVQKQQSASTVLQNLENAFVQYNHSQDDFHDCVDGLKLEQQRKDKAMAALAAGTPVSDTELASIPIDQLTWQINALDATLDYRVSLASVRRMLLQGYYANLDGSLAHPHQ